MSRLRNPTVTGCEAKPEIRGEETMLMQQRDGGRLVPESGIVRGLLRDDEWRPCALAHAPHWPPRIADRGTANGADRDRRPGLSPVFENAFHQRMSMRLRFIQWSPTQITGARSTRNRTMTRAGVTTKPPPPSHHHTTQSAHHIFYHPTGILTRAHFIPYPPTHMDGCRKRSRGAGSR